MQRLSSGFMYLPRNVVEHENVQVPQECNVDSNFSYCMEFGLFKHLKINGQELI